MKKSLQIKKWYESYETAPPWSSVVSLVAREREKAHLQGFIEGAHATGEQADEIMAEKVEKAKQKERASWIKDLQKRADNLQCTADDFGYHDKNCEGLPCEKAVLEYIIKIIK